MYRSIGGGGGSSVRNRAKATAGTNGFGLLVTIVGIILLSLLLNWNASTTSATEPNVTVTCLSSFSPNNTLCNGTTECLQGFYNEEENDCFYLPYPTSVTNCTSACYSQGDTACDAMGNCVGDATACTGACSMDSYCVNTLEPLNDDVLFYYDPTTFWTYSSWYHPQQCVEGTCLWGVLEIFAGSSIYPFFSGPTPVPYNFTVLAAQLRCSDYVRPEFLAEHKECLMFERYLLASSVINYEQFSDYTYGNESYPFQTSICLISFTCSVPTQAADIITRRRAVMQTEKEEEEPVYKSREAWGFHSTEPGDTVDSGVGPLGATDPRVRNRLWSHLYNMITEAAPVYLPSFLELNGFTKRDPVPVSST